MDCETNKHQRSLNMISTNMDQTYHENLQQTYTDEIAMYQKRRDDLFAKWDQHKIEAKKRVVAIQKKTDALVIEVDRSILSQEQNALLDAADKIIASITTSAIENLHLRHQDINESLEFLQLSKESTQNSMDNISSYIKSLFE